jgi:hypothetical protein
MQFKHQVPKRSFIANMAGLRLAEPFDLKRVEFALAQQREAA